MERTRARHRPLIREPKRCNNRERMELDHLERGACAALHHTALACFARPFRARPHIATETEEPIEHKEMRHVKPSRDCAQGTTAGMLPQSPRITSELKHCGRHRGAHAACNPESPQHHGRSIQHKRACPTAHVGGEADAPTTRRLHPRALTALRRHYMRLHTRTALMNVPVSGLHHLRGQK